MHDYQIEVVSGAVEQPLSYLVPRHFVPLIKPLSRVMVPLQKRHVMAFCLGRPYVGQGGKLRPVADVLDDVTCLPPEMLKFFERAAAYYQAPLGKFLEQALPAGLGKLRHQDARSLKAQLLVELLDKQESEDLPAQMRSLLDILQASGPLWLAGLKERFPRASYWLPRMEKLGLVKITRHSLIRDITGGIIHPEAAPEAMTAEQEEAIAHINSAVRAGAFKSFLLHGVTGSGKTEVYLAACREALALGKTALILVPEIGLCLRLQSILESRLQEGDVAVLHSGLSPAARRQQWAALASGRARVALGARSAVFAPLSNLGVICVDEEQDEAYKQEDRIRYNGRDLALLRGQEQDCPVVLGSATPSLASYYMAGQGRHQLLHMPKRVRNLALPRMEMIDLRTTPGLEGGFLSPRLYQALKETKELGQQSILFLNRRGFAPAIICAKCGEKISCPACSLSFTWHEGKQRLVCHLCGTIRRLPAACSNCRSGAENFKPLGLGTEAVEAKIKELQPHWRLARLDRDTAANPAQLKHILRQVLNREVDVLIGTQMLSKGHHFPGIRLVGVLLADQGLNQPDYRAGERAFTLLTQVAGRAGREHERGLVLVQTFNPHHHAIQAAFKHDSTGFYEQELDERRALGYPPFGRLISIRIDSVQEPLAREVSARLGGHLCQAMEKLRLKAQILGPAPASVAKVQHHWRYFLLIKAGSASQAARILRLGLFRLGEFPGQVKIMVDVDPLQLL